MNTPAAQQHPDYLASLGLQRAPFLDQIDDRFFYADPQLVQRLDLLQHLIQFGDMLLSVSGPAGSGKSTLLPQLLRRGTTTWRSCRINGGQIQQPLDLLTQLAEGFGLDRSAAPERLKADLLRLFQTLRHTSLIPVVVVDDAHLMPDPALKTLLELGGEPRETLKLLRVVLFSESGLEQRLIQASWHSPLQPLLHNLDLPRFDDHQTAAYLMYRLAVAGYSGESPFSLTEIRALHKSADGLPGKLNVLAHEALMERASRVATHRGAATAKAVGRRPLLVAGTAAGVLILGALGGYLFTRSPDETVIEVPSAAESAPQPAPEAPATATAAPQAEPEATRTEAAAPAPEADQTGEPTSTDQPTVAAPTAPGTAAPAAEPAPAGTQIQTPPPASAAADSQTAAATPPTTDTPAGSAGQTPTAPAPAAPVEEKTAPATVEQPPVAQTVTTPPAAQPDAAAPPATGPAPTEPKPESQAATPAAATVEPPQQAETAQTPPAATTLASEGAAKPAPPPPPLNLPAGVLQADWLLERPPGHFALQLLAVRQPDSLRGYLRDHTIPAPVAVFRAHLKGSDWYVLVQGDYPSMSAARTAVAELPAAVRRTKPWPRSFVSIHTDIRKTAR